MIDDRELAARFKARADRLPEPSPALFTITTQRLDAFASRRTDIAQRIALLWKHLSLQLRIATSGGLVAAMLIAVFAVTHLTQPGVTSDAVLDKAAPSVEAPAPIAGAVAPPAPPRMAKQIKINTLKTESRMAAPAGGVAAEPEAKKAADANAAIARAETLELLVRDVPSAIATLQTIARTNGGLVSKVDDSTAPDADTPRTATLTLTVAAPQLDAATARILALGAVQSRSATAESIGDSIVDDQARLRNLRREETDLLRIMDRSGNVTSILAVESKLADVRGDIETLTAHLATSNHRVATSQIDVTLTESRPTAAPATPSFGDHVTTTWHAALRSLAAGGIAIADFGVWLLAYAPVWIALAIAIALTIRLRRSRF